LNYRGVFRQTNTKPRPMRGFVCLYFPSLRSCAEERFELWLIKANDHFLVHQEDRYAHLAALLDHFLALLKIACDIVLSVLNVALLKKFLSHLAEVTGWCAVNCYVLIHTSSLVESSIARRPCG